MVIGNPTNPTSVLHPADALVRLARPGRTLVVDEAFMDAVPGEREALAGRTDVPGLVVLRSLTKTWGLAGLRVGYVLADPETVARLERAQPLWPVSTPGAGGGGGLRGACGAGRGGGGGAGDRGGPRVSARGVAGLRVPRPAGGVPAEAPFVLVRVPNAAAVRRRLRTLGYAVRRGTRSRA